MNFDRLRYIAERTEIGEQKEAILRYNCLKKLVHFWIFVVYYKDEISLNLIIVWMPPTPIPPMFLLVSD